MSRKKLIIILIILLLIVGGILSFYYINNKDAIKFKKSFESYNNQSLKYDNKSGKYLNVKVDYKNPIIYLSDDNLLKELKNDSKLVLFGSAKDNNTRAIISTLFEVAKDNSVEKIYFYDISNLEKKYASNDKNAIKIYEEITKLLDSNLTDTFIDGPNKGKKRINLPTVIVVNKEKVVSFHSGTIESHKDYFKGLTKKEKDELYKTYENVVLDLIMCTDDC